MKDGISIWRDARGVPHVEASNEADMYWGLGYVHARDRGMQVLFMRILGQGRVSELLDSSDESLLIDMFFRRMNWYSKTQKELNAISDRERKNVEAYTAGINAGFAKKVPWEMKLVGYKPEPWKPEHSVIISRMVGYLTLAQSQGEIERLFVEMVQAGIDQEKLEALFPGILGGLDIELLKKVILPERTVPSHLLWNTAVPRMMASNNWAVSGSKTVSGKPILANDPHLEINRLPNVWSEAVLSCNGRYAMGGTMPGAPGILIGRTPDVAWGATYSFIDAIDSWVEHCKDGKYYHEEGDRWLAFEVREEVIKRKKKEDVKVTFYENEHGVLEGDPNQEGYYLATRWTGSESGSQVVTGIMEMWDAKTAEDGMASLGKAESCFNWVFADKDGNIGFQMSGHVPVRREGVRGKG